MEQVMKMEGAADMKTEELRKIWKAEEALAHIHGWDFSHIDSRYREEGSLPWDYRKIILSHLGDRDYLLDMDTGGGEFLLSLGHPYSRTSATEAYPPNAELCRRLLAPLGIDFREAPGNQTLPFADSCFDMVINRHGNYDALLWTAISSAGRTPTLHRRHTIQQTAVPQ